MPTKEGYIISDKESMEKQENIRILRKVIKDIIKGVGINKLSFSLILKDLGYYHALRIKDFNELKETFNEVCNIDNIILDVNWDSHKENIEKFTRKGFIDFAAMFDPYADLNESENIPKASEKSLLIVKEILEEMNLDLYHSIPIQDLIDKAKERGLNEDKIEESIERLKRRGDVYEPRKGFVSPI